MKMTSILPHHLYWEHSRQCSIFPITYPSQFAKC